MWWMYVYNMKKIIIKYKKGTQETFKQVLQKLTKKNAAPLMLWFDNPNNMEIISNKKAALQDTFQLFDTKKLGRIDATELFAVILFMSKGDYNLKIMSK